MNPLREKRSQIERNRYRVSFLSAGSFPLRFSSVDWPENTGGQSIVSFARKWSRCLTASAGADFKLSTRPVGKKIVSAETSHSYQRKSTRVRSPLPFFVARIIPADTHALTRSYPHSRSRNSRRNFPNLFLQIRNRSRPLASDGRCLSFGCVTVPPRNRWIRDLVAEFGRR